MARGSAPATFTSSSVLGHDNGDAYTGYKFMIDLFLYDKQLWKLRDPENGGKALMHTAKTPDTSESEDRTICGNQVYKASEKCDNY